jgi:hypothetical protein
MNRVFYTGLLALCLISFAASAAQAATANFQGNCQWNTAGTNINCLFDAKRPASSPSSCSSGIPTYFWDYGDYTSSGFTSASFVSHTYVPPHPFDYWVNLSVFCPDGSSASATRVVCFRVGTPGCIFVTFPPASGTWY